MKTTIFTSILALTLCFNTFANAETLNNKKDVISAKKEEIKAKIEQVEVKKQAVENKKEEKVSLLKSIIQKFQKVEEESLKTKTLKNFEVAIRNLENLSRRVSSRIEKTEIAGDDIAEAKVLLEKANSDIILAKNELVKLTDTIPDNFNKNSKKESIEAVKEQTKNTKEAIKVAQASITEVISSIKGPEDTKIDEEISTSSTTDNINQDE
jgi:hypothetical protein